MTAFRHAERLRLAAVPWQQRVAPASAAALLLLALWLAVAPHSRTSRPAQLHCGSAAVTTAGAAAGGWPTAGDTLHVVHTSNGRPYVNYQTLILYGTFRLARRMPGGEKMVGFTRILHRGADDQLSPCVPTFRVDPLHPACDAPAGCGYVQADRANAVRKYLDAVRRDPSLIRAPWIYMIEPDFVYIKPVIAPLAESGAKAIGFRYGNIAPHSKALEPLMRRLYPAGYGPLSDLPPTGPSPLLMRVGDWIRVAPRWEGYTAQIEADPESHTKIGSVREMYAFVVAAAVERLEIELQSPPDSILMIQPPVQDSLGKAAQLHYTWESSLRWPNGSIAWHFEKREYNKLELLDTMPKIMLPPPFEEGWSTPSAAAPEGRPTTRALYDTLRLLVETINRGIDEVGGHQWKQVLKGGGVRPW